MKNVFGSKQKPFTWASLGDIDVGRGNLGGEMPVLVYRLMQFTLIDVLSQEFGLDGANDFIRKAGHLAGTEFAKNVLDTTLEFDAFVAHLQEALKTLKIGVMRMESTDPETGEMMLTVSEDLDCSGLPVTNENVCVYDEGFIAGILKVYTGKEYDVREIDCWASGARVCRFKGLPA